MARESDSRPDSASGARGGSQRHRQTTRDLLDASVEIFGRKGFESSRVAEIARRCGVTTGAIYARWPNKLELFAAAVEHVMGHLTAVALQEAKDSSAEEWLALIALVTNLVSAERDDARGIVLEAYALARRNPQLRDFALQSLTREIDSLASFISEGKDIGTVDRSLSTEAVALCCQALLVGVHLVLTALGDGQHRPTDDEWNALIARFMSAMAPPSSDDDSVEPPG